VALVQYINLIYILQKTNSGSGSKYQYPPVYKQTSCLHQFRNGLIRLYFLHATNNSPPPRMKRFTAGEWTVEPDLDRISRDSEEVNLQPQVMELLVYLAENANEVVSIDDMIEDVWEGRLMSSGSVYNRLTSLRKALQDDPQNPTYIETIHKRGYRLIAKVSFDDDAPPDPSGSDRKPIYRPETRPAALWTAVAAVAVVLLAVWSFYNFGRETPEPSVAVLPFVDMSPDGDQQYFADGVSEEIINAISAIPGLKVVGRTSSFHFRGQEIDLRQIGEELGVAYLLEGSVRRDGANLRVTAQLIEAEGGFHIWSREFDGDMVSVFQIQEDVAASIAHELGVSMPGLATRSEQEANHALSVDISAYDLFLLARERINRGGREDLEEAVDLLQRALEIDPTLARAHAELAYAYITQRNLFARDYDYSDELWTLDGPAARHAEAALALDPTQADALAVQGMLYQVQWAVQRTTEYESLAEQKYKESLAINPNNARTHIWLSGLMRNMQRSWNARLAPARRAIELDPLWNFAGGFYVSLIQDMPALRPEKWRIIRQLQEDEPDNDRWKHYAAMASLFEGEVVAAVGTWKDLIDSGDDAYTFIHDSALLNIGAKNLIAKPADEIQPFLASQYPDGPSDWLAMACPDSDLLEQPYSGAVVRFCLYSALVGGSLDFARTMLAKTGPASPQELQRDYRRWLGRPESVATSLATLYWLDGDTDRALAILSVEEESLAIQSENGTIRTGNFMGATLLVHALRGENDQALDQLESLIEAGNYRAAVFMHPALRDLRDMPRFQALLARWMEGVNRERARLGLDPLLPNPDVGPGVLPFLLEEQT
jgi:TolB-like protein/DNA-binding winged helix-turn-helix (wHTH) protein